MNESRRRWIAVATAFILGLVVVGSVLGRSLAEDQRTGLNHPAELNAAEVSASNEASRTGTASSITVGGTIASDTTWTVNDSPVVVTQNLLVDEEGLRRHL